MSTIIRALGYTGTLQRLVIPEGFGADITVYAWGGGGGGSGGDSGGARRGGNGGGGGYIAKTLTVVSGDILDIAVGQGGGVGGGASQGGPGSAGGASLKLPQLQYTVGGILPLTFDILTIGGGGGGGGGSSRPYPWSGSGGGSAAIRRSSATVNPGDRIGITVANGGAAGAPRDGPYSSGAPGSLGNTTTVLLNDNIVTSAYGGGGGNQANTGQPAAGAGGQGGVGTSVLTSTPGTSSSTDTGGTGGRGYVAPSDAADTVTYGSAGAGGIGNSNTPGQAGTVYGGGGGGGGCNGANDRLGDQPAAGGSGLVVISYTTVDGVPVFSGGAITIVGLRVTHTFSIPGSEVAYNGGSGGASINGQYSGAGGGGGGATVVLLNGTIIGYAGGGGGGGGCGNTLGAGSDAPGPNGQSGSATAGSNGQTSGVGGGGGGGAGGNGGAGNPSEGLAQAGAFGLRLGDVTQAPNARQPGGTNTPYYSGVAGYGGVGQNLGNGGGQPGTSGYAVVVLTPRSFFVKDGGNWNPINAIYARTVSGWTRVKTVFVKQNNTWTPVVGGSDDYAPTFSSVSGGFGSIPRPYGS